MKALIILIVLLHSTLPACLWVKGTTINGWTHAVSGYGVARQLQQSMEISAAELYSRGKFIIGTEAPDKAESESIKHIIAGDLDTAITILKKLETDFPGDYSTAANLGTAYELIGDNANALKWIAEGIHRNEDSHYGTEWLHALILKAKIASAKEPDQALKVHLIEVPKSMNSDTIISVDGVNRSMSDVRSAMIYQLHERMVFVKPRDPYVADLLYSLALIEAHLSTVETGLELLELARQYGFPDVALLEEQKQSFQFIITMAGIKWYGLWIVGGGLFLYLCYRQKWFFLTHRAYLAHKASKVTRSA